MGLLKTTIGIVGAGTMGAGIAQLASTVGHECVIVDTSEAQRKKAEAATKTILAKQVEKGRLSDSTAKEICGRLLLSESLKDLSRCGLVIEAIVEDIGVKKQLFSELERIVSPSAILATNTSSLSVTAIAAACSNSSRVIGLHFFNPAPLMPLVEIIPGTTTSPATTQSVKELMTAWDKSAVIAQDTPGFIVNRLARPFYSEAIKMLEEGVADVATIDWAMREIGGFRMGPFELMDLIGNDVNFAVTKSVFESFFYDQRYRPSLTQQRLVESGRLGRKTGRGYYDYGSSAINAAPKQDRQNAESIVQRIVAVMINGAVEALSLRIASRHDLDLAMVKGTNYPRGLLAWCDEWGATKVCEILDQLFSEYGEQRYRVHSLLRRCAANGQAISNL